MAGISVDNTFQNSPDDLPEENSSDLVTFSSPGSGPGTSDVLVLNARSRQSLMAIRSLGKRGLRMAAMETPDCTVIPSFASRWCQHPIICPASTETKEHLAYFQQLLIATQARLAIPTSDGDVALLRQYREMPEARGRVAIAREPALAIAVSKEQTLDVAKRLGMRIPRGVLLASANETAAALSEVGLPAVVKPEESWIENGQQGIRVACYLVTTPDEARQAVEKLTSLGGKVLFQQYLTGRREAVSFLYAKQQIYARFAQWARRTHPPLGGTSILRQSIAIPIDIGEQAEHLIREIDLEGYSEVEFRRDSAGYPYLMEINPRLSASVEIAVRAGVDFPYLLYQWATESPIDTVKGYRSGLWMRYLGGDFATMLASLQQRGRPGISSPAKTIFDFCSSFFIPMRYDYLDWHDPAPAWAATKGAFRNIWRRAKKSASNNLQK